MASPNPVPPNFRVVDESTWLNASNRLLCFCLSIPMPVSFTSIDNCHWVALLVVRLTRITTSPASVNLIALPTKLVRICRIRPESLTMKSSHKSTTSNISSKPFSWAIGAIPSVNSPSIVRRLNSMFSSSSFLASILEKSRMSSIKARSERALL